MCTASWRWENGEPELWFSRDEQRTRPASLPPRTDAAGATYAVDPQGGGTWLFVNRHGLIGALLNGYGPRPPGPLRSRGLLLKGLSDCGDLETVRGRLELALAEHRYNSFYVVALQDSVKIWHWDGDSLTEHVQEEAMLTTSSYETERVVAARKAYFRETVRDPRHPSAEELKRFHGWRDGERPYVSVRMERADACTVSVARISGGRLDMGMAG